MYKELLNILAGVEKKNSVQREVWRDEKQGQTSKDLMFVEEFGTCLLKQKKTNSFKNQIVNTVCPQNVYTLQQLIVQFKK